MLWLMPATEPVMRAPPRGAILGAILLVGLVESCVKGLDGQKHTANVEIEDLLDSRVGELFKVVSPSGTSVGNEDIKLAVLVELVKPASSTSAPALLET